MILEPFVCPSCSEIRLGDSKLFTGTFDHFLSSHFERNSVMSPTTFTKQLHNINFIIYLFGPQSSL